VLAYQPLEPVEPRRHQRPASARATPLAVDVEVDGGGVRRAARIQDVAPPAPARSRRSSSGRRPPGRTAGRCGRRPTRARRPARPARCARPPGRSPFAHSDSRSPTATSSTAPGP
jgi:hypothetical protein